MDEVDIVDLPDELLIELNLTAKSDDLILALFGNSKTLSISECLVGYYRAHGEVKSRQYMTVALYRMVKKNLLKPASGKGCYKLSLLGSRITKIGGATQ